MGQGGQPGVELSTYLVTMGMSVSVLTTATWGHWAYEVWLGPVWLEPQGAEFDFDHI